MNLNLDDELIEDVQVAFSEEANEKLNRTRLKARLLEEFGRIRKNQVDEPVLAYRLEQLNRMAERLVVKFVDLKLVVEPHPQDQLSFQLFKFGCGWHESLAIEALVRECLPDNCM
jgi:hypothetical protein